MVALLPGMLVKLLWMLSQAKSTNLVATTSEATKSYVYPSDSEDSEVAVEIYPAGISKFRES